MERLIVKWNVSYIDNTVERYCHGCGRKTVFMDSGKRRHNANGKNIYEYAIYKCSLDHTWNKTLNIYKSCREAFELEAAEGIEPAFPEVISLSSINKSGFKEIEIILDNVSGKLRLDKLLSSYIEGLSRSKIKSYIKEGKIMVDDTFVDPDMNVRSGQRILIML